MMLLSSFSSASSLESLSTLSACSSSTGRGSRIENFNRLSRAPPSSAGRDRLKTPCTGGVGSLAMLWMGSEVTFVQLTNASRCVDGLRLCGIALECTKRVGTGQRGIRRDDATDRSNYRVTLSLIGVCHVFTGARKAWLFAPLPHQLEQRLESA